MEKKEIWINFISLSTVFIEILSTTWEILSKSTWFLYEYRDNIYMITNKHVVTGKNIETWKLLSKTWAIPEKLRLHIPNSPKTPKWKFFFRYVINEIDIFEENWKEKYLTHENNKVDVVAFKFNIISWSKKVYLPINKNDFSNFDIQVSDNVFIIWYPVWIIWWNWPHKLPIWKRWNVASEPQIDYWNLPRFIIDTSTREWMSGSPVIWRHDWVITNWKNWEILVNDYIWVHYNFVWIYSWRLFSNSWDDFVTQL